MSDDERTPVAPEHAPECVFWSCDPEEPHLTALTIADAVHDWAADRDRPLPEWVRAYGYDRCELPAAEVLATHICATLLDWLDEEYGDDDDATAPSPAIEAAALALATVSRGEYHVWRCGEVTAVEVRVADYLGREGDA